MAERASDLLTARFYEWEKRGRGWLACPNSVEPEPVFWPFFGHFLPEQPVIDDGKHETIFSSIANLFRRKTETQQEVNPLFEIPPVEGVIVHCTEDVIIHTIVFPKGEKIEVEDMERLLLMLSYTNYPVSFEIVATNAAITLQLACKESDTAQLRSQVKAYFPGAVLIKHDAGLDIFADAPFTCAGDFGLSEEFMRPLRMTNELDADPYIGLFAALEHLFKGERGIIQILFKGVLHPWGESIMRSVTDSKGDSFFVDAPEMVKMAQEKVSAPLFSVCVRLGAQAATNSRCIEIAEGIGSALTRLTSSKGNKLVILPRDGYSLDSLTDDMFLRESHRLGMLLNCKELATMVHFPTPKIVSPKVARDTKKTKAAPESAQGHPFILGMNAYQGYEQLVSVPASLRLRHTHVIGATGTGKSTMLLSMIAQDMQQGNGLSVLDPHGDLIESILAYVPQNRIDDVILIDPADGEFPVGFNILSAHSEIEKDILSSDLVAAFRRLSTSWGDQMNSVFANAILAFLESKQGGTLVDLRRFLIEKPFRDAYLKTVPDPHIVYYWQHEYPLLKSSSIGSILTRLDTFLRPKLIRNMVAQKKGLDFESILDTKKILLVKLSQGLIGEENSFLLGTFFVSKMYQAAMARQAKSKAERSDFFLYIDEFQNFITPSMSYILSGARKYHLGLILAHQDMQQLQKYDTELASSVVVNAGTRICFRLGDADAKRFASGFSYFEAEDLMNLHTGEAIGRIDQPNFDFSLTTIPLPEVKENIAELTRQAVIARSKEKYGTAREEVEKSLEHLGKIALEEKIETQEHTRKEPPPPVPEPPVNPAPPVEIPIQRVTKQKSETQHRYLQTLIKRMAESRGYIALIEQQTPDGKGRVDVSLERAGKKIACEVSVTTGDAWEIHNVEKCLAAGYDEVIVCSDDVKNLKRIRKQIADTLPKEQQAKVLTLESPEVVKYFDKQIVEEAKTEKVIKGYRVKTQYASSTNEEMAKKQENIIKTIAENKRKKRT
jgi:DNA helicase HerA-like ATPase